MTPLNNHDSTAGPNTSEPAIELAERFALIVNQHPVIRSGFVLLRQQEALFKEPLVVFVVCPVPQLGRPANGDLVNSLEIISEHGLGDAGWFILAFNLDGDFLNYLEALIVNLIHSC